MDVVDRLNLLQKNSGMNQKDLARAIGLSLSIFKTLLETVESQMDPLEEKLFINFRKLPNYCKINLLSYLEGMLDALPDEKLSESVSINKQKEGKE